VECCDTHQVSTQNRKYDKVFSYSIYVSKKVLTSTWHQPLSKGFCVKATQMTGQQVVDIFQDLDSGEVNLINLKVRKDNPTPACLENLLNYSIRKDKR
jgi:hypothetical protein